MHRVEGYSIRQIAKRLHVCRNTVRNVLRTECESEVGYERKNAHKPKLGPYEDKLREILTGEWEKPPRQRRNATLLYEELQGYGYDGAVDSVRRCVNRWRAERNETNVEAFVPLVFMPGDAMQFDWSTERVVIAGVPMVVKAAQMRLCHSRMCLVQVFRYERQEMMLEGLRRAVRFFGGTPRRLVVDNLTSAVKKVLVGKERIWQDKFQGFCSHYLINPRACQVNKPTDKGQIERQVGVMRERFFKPLPAAASFEELNDRLMSICVERAKTTAHPEVRAMSVWQMWREEAAHLTALPPGDYECCRVEEEKRVDRYCTVAFDANRYSAPSRLVGRRVQVRGYAEHVKIVCDGNVVAEHGRLFGRGDAAYNPLHYLDVLEKKPGALENGRPFVQWQMPESLDRARAALARTDGEREFVKLLLLLREYSLDEVCAAVDMALEHGAPYTGRVENILRRLGDEAPPRQECPVIIRLRVEPAADPSVYDTRLRREAR
jgi:transposase